MRAEMFFTQSIYTIYPDYLRRYKKHIQNFLSIDQVTEWATNVTVFNPASAFQIAFRMQLQEVVTQLVYATILD
jgi:hypothetical protein